MTQYQPGDPVWYRQVSPGGYGFAANIPATFVRRTPRRITVRVTLHDGSTRDIHVAAHNVRPRPLP